MTGEHTTRPRQRRRLIYCTNRSTMSNELSTALSHKWIRTQTNGYDTYLLPHCAPPHNHTLAQNDSIRNRSETKHKIKHLSYGIVYSIFCLVRSHYSISLDANAFQFHIFVYRSLPLFCPLLLLLLTFLWTYYLCISLNCVSVCYEFTAIAFPVKCVLKCASNQSEATDAREQCVYCNFESPRFRFHALVCMYVCVYACMCINWIFYSWTLKCRVPEEHRGFKRESHKRAIENSTENMPNKLCYIYTLAENLR